MKKVDKLNQVLTRRVEKIYPSKAALEKVLRSGKKIRLYQGFDPSTPNLHIGHLVGLLKLKEFQQLGHEVIFLIGDFTGMIGDPTGKIEGARPQLSHEKTLKNAQGYKKQAGMILNFTGKNQVKIKYNGQWLAKLGIIELASLMHNVTYPQIIKRDMFKKRMEKGQDVLLNEFFYPFLQAYDCIHMDVDLEIGGADQMFNMLVGRDLMKKLKNKEKFVMTTKLLVDSKGEKIGKTEGNAINIANPPAQFFGQIMSLTDDCILPCFELITEVPMDKLEEIKQALKKGENPMQFKKQLAFELVKMLHDQKTARSAQINFEKIFQKKGSPQSIPTKKAKNNTNIIDLLTESKICASRSQAKRLVQQKAVETDQKIITDISHTVSLPTIIKVGKKKFIRFEE